LTLIYISRSIINEINIFEKKELKSIEREKERKREREREREKRGKLKLK
jgi:hypothetical protein